MQNYSQVFADVLAEFESPYVPGDQGDAGKGQVTVRAAYKINSTMNPRVGCITKNPGQTQFHGVAVDALLDNVDGSGADFLTDELQPDGQRLIKLAYSVYATPPPGTPVTNWTQPTAAMLDYPGPLTLKGDAPAPGPDPEPSPDDDAIILAALDDIGATLAQMQIQQEADTAAILARDDTNTEKSMQQIRDLVEDVEETLIEIAILLLLRRPGSGESKAQTASVEAVVEDFRDRIHARQQARQQDREARRI